MTRYVHLEHVPEVQFFAGLESRDGRVLVLGELLTRGEARALAARLYRAADQLEEVLRSA